MRALNDFNFTGKRALVRCEFDVPLDSQGDILDDFRIRESLPTIRYLMKQGARVILMSHLGRPGGKIVEALRLTPIQKRLSEYLNVPVVKTEDCIGSGPFSQAANMKPGDVLLLENLRFHPEEEENSASFAKELAMLADIYINDAFGVAHRAHASIVGVALCLPSAAGLLLIKEVEALSRLVKNPAKPLVVIIGGAKVETKVKLIDKFSELADFILIGGLIQKEIEEKNVSLQCPQKIIEPVDDINRKDITERTLSLFKEKIAQAKTIFWNGPVGQVEKEEFSKGTEEIARAIIDSSAYSVVGGGETVEFLSQIGLIEKFSHVSTGGGAMLAFLSGEKLPGLEALEQGITHSFKG